MALRKDITARILDLLTQNPRGLSITEIVKNSDINRNTAGRYLDNLLVLGQVEMRHFGMAKIYTRSQRLPVSSVLSLSSEYVIQIDSGLRVVFLNKPFADLLGHAEKEIIGKNIEFTTIPSFFDDRYPRLLASVRDGLNGDECRGELDLPSSSRSYAYRIVPIVFANGQKGVSVIFEDITDWKRNEEALRKSEAWYRSLTEASQDLIFVISKEDRVLFINQKAADILELSADDVIGQPRSRFFPKEISDFQYRRLQQVFSTGQPVRDEGPLTSCQGKVLWFDHALVPIRDSEGRVISVMGVSRDITRRIFAEHEQLQNEENRRFIAERSVDIIHRMTPDLVLLYVSPSITTLLGYGERELLGNCLVAMIYPEDMPGVMAELDAACQSDRDRVTLTFRFRHKDGHYILFETATRIIRDSAGKARELLNISRDISGRNGR